MSQPEPEPLGSPQDQPWLQSAPPETLATDVATMHRVTEADIPEIVVAVNETLDDLKPWLPWAQQAATQESIAAFVSEAATHWESREAFQYVTRHLGEVAGCCGLMSRMGPGTLEIGYWVRKKFQRRGIATAAAKALTGAALKMPELEQVAIRCDPENEPSACVPAKLGFLLHGIYERPPELPGGLGHHERLMVWLTKKR
jgi:RimJ/RimL family protein N-acetyltransferase